MKKILYLAVIFALIAIGAFALIRIPPKADVAAFNRYYKTSLSAREIYFSESGFVDSEFHASIPMTSAEFVETTGAIGMTKTKRAARQNSSDRPWWWQKPKGEVYILNRINQNNHRDYIEAHFDSIKNVAYFFYFDH